MKTRVATWIAAFALAGVCSGQQSEEEKRFYADYAKSEQRAIADYPDVTNPESPISKVMGQIDKALNASGDPLYHSPDKPYIIAQRAASALGIAAGGKEKPQDTKTAKVADSGSMTSMESLDKPLENPSAATGNLKLGSPEWIAKRDEAWKRLQDYYPEYCDPALLPATYQFVKEWDAWAKVNRPDVYKNPMKPIIYCKWQKAAEAKAAEEKQAQAEIERAAMEERGRRAIADSRAAMQEVEDHYRNEYQQQNAASDQREKEFQEYSRERRLKKLEDAERDRLNRERDQLRK